MCHSENWMFCPWFERMAIQNWLFYHWKKKNSGTQIYQAIRIHNVSYSEWKLPAPYHDHSIIKQIINCLDIQFSFTKFAWVPISQFICVIVCGWFFCVEKWHYRMRRDAFVEIVINRERNVENSSITHALNLCLNSTLLWLTQTIELQSLKRCKCIGKLFWFHPSCIH